MKQHLQKTRRLHGGSGPTSRLVSVSSVETIGTSDKPTLHDIESALRYGGFEKYEGTPAPRGEDFRSITWENDNKDRIYILMPPGKDYESLKKCQDYLIKIFDEKGSRSEALSRSTNNILKGECTNISIHFNMGTEAPHDKISMFSKKEAEKIIQDCYKALSEYDEVLSRAESAIGGAKKLLPEFAP